ncbi:hypothetical protein ACWCO0_08055 [Streptomyces tubercidicus]|uniref:Uncharacterized protein n=1 Tax=Streptomyces tubercidicus TaxID=47759 RepID=A0A640UJK0_9ACTN|nr:hypothetical protein [Streptomyces tubercidicus]WAU10399.1 hypothetical protein STRTU_000479 [Streptomyces tubercidicus]GFE35492.1 hypothetical protein Stube_01650 [Streptomyces tubercidicus]
MAHYRPTPPPYGVTPDYVLAPPRPEERLGAPTDRQGPPPPSASRVGHVLPPPRPEDRLPFGPPLPQDRPFLPPRPEEQRQGPVALPDRRRQDLQAALTAAGVAPTDGDLAALAAIAALGDTTAGAVINWLGAAARASWPRPHAV